MAKVSEVRPESKLVKTGNANSQPQQLIVGFSKQATKSMNTVNVQSNQFKLKLGSKAVVYQYKLEIIGMKIWDASLVHRILKSKKTAIDTALGLN